MQFVDADDIDIAFYDTPYYTEPTKAGRRAYALLRETMKRTSKIGVAKIVIRERQHLCAVLADGPAIIAYTLRWPYQLREPSDLELPSEDLEELAVTPQELKMAEQLVETMVGEWKPEEYRDTYHDDVLAMIEEKAKSGKVTVRGEPGRREGGEVVDIMALLKRSVEERKPSPAAKVTAKGKG
jgi:DNA end-binding protein Ku